MSSPGGDSHPSSSAAARDASSSSSSSSDRSVVIEYTFANVHLMFCIKTFETLHLLRLADLALDLARNRAEVASQKETATALEQSSIALQSAKISHASTAALAKDVFRDFETTHPGELDKRPLNDEELSALRGAAADLAAQVRVYRDLRFYVETGTLMIETTEPRILEALNECKTRPGNHFREQTEDAIEIAAEALKETHRILLKTFQITANMEENYVETIHTRWSKDEGRHKAANAASHCDYKK